MYCVALDEAQRGRSGGDRESGFFSTDRGRRHLATLDVEIHYLRSDIGKRWHELSADRQSDLLAYRLVHLGTSPERAMLSMPSTYQDLLQAALVYRGKSPADVLGKSGGPPMAPTAPVTVVGGKLTPQIEMMANAWGRAQLPALWARKTGSDPALIRRLMSGEG